MYWSKVKTVLIFFLIITNAILLMNLYSNNKDTLFLKKEVISSTVSILEKNGVKIDNSIIPKRIVTLKQFEADNIIKSYDEFSQAVLGEGYEKITNTHYQSDKGYIDFSGDRFNISLKSDKGIPASKEQVLEFFKEFNLELTDFEYRNGQAFKKNGKYDIFDCKITFQKSGDTLNISGVWYEKNKNAIYYGSEIKPVTSALIDFLSDPMKPEEACSITNIKLGYMLSETASYHKSIVPMPVWELELSNKQKIYISARANV